VIAAKHMGKKFQEYESDSAVMVVLESPTPLGDDAKRYYAALVKRLEQRHHARSACAEFLG
jgi:putative drug exporter of the RND superfamily